MWTAILAFCWRCRGGFLGLGSTLATRLVFWCLPVMIAGYTLFDWYGLLFGLTAYLGLLISYAPFMGDNQLKHCSGMAAVGTARAFVLLIPLLVIHPELWYLGFLGSLAGVGYYIGWTYLTSFDSGISFPGLSVFGKTIIQPGRFATGGGEWGEVFTGASFGLLFDILTILLLI